MNSYLLLFSNFQPLDIITEQCTYICDSKSRNIFLGFLYGYKMLLQVMALFLSFSIRKVKVKGLNDAKSIAASIYVTSMVLAVLIVSSYTLKAYINVFASLFCIGFFAGTTVILILVFVPLVRIVVVVVVVIIVVVVVIVVVCTAAAAIVLLLYFIDGWIIQRS